MSEKNFSSQRCQPRTEFYGTTVIYDLDGQILTIGGKGILNSAGAGVVSYPCKLKIGDRVVMDFLGSGYLSPFVNECEVVSLPDVFTDDKVMAGLKFIGESTLARRVINRFQEENKKQLQAEDVMRLPKFNSKEAEA